MKVTCSKGWPHRSTVTLCTNICTNLRLIIEGNRRLLLTRNYGSTIDLVSYINYNSGETKNRVR